MFMWDKLCVRTETFLAVKYVTLGCSVILPKSARYKILGTSNNLTGEIFKICSKQSSAFAVGNSLSRLPTDEMLDTKRKTEAITIYIRSTSISVVNSLTTLPTDEMLDTMVKT